VSEGEDVKTVPYSTCQCGKRGWDDDHEAGKALGKARAKRERLADKGGSRRGMKRENRTYVCPMSGLLHLTEQSRRTYTSYAGLAA
jgi:hypothetical protein